MNPPQAEYDLTLDDVLAFYDDALYRAPSARRQVRNVTIMTPLLAIGLGLLLTSLIGTGFPPEPFWLVAIGLTALFTIWFAPTTTHKTQMKQVRKLFEEEERRKHLGPSKVILRPDGVTVASPLGASVASWEVIQEIATTPDYVFLHFDSLTALVVPRRAFPDDAAFEKFIEAARMFKRNAPDSV